MKKLTKKKREKVATIVVKVTIVIMAIFAISFFICLVMFQIKGVIDEKPYELITLHLLNGAIFSVILFFLEMHFIGKFINMAIPKKLIKNTLLSEARQRERKYGKVVKAKEYDDYKYEIRQKGDKYKAIILKKIWYDQYQTYDSYDKKYEEDWAEFDSSIEMTNDLDIANNYAKDFIQRSRNET